MYGSAAPSIGLVIGSFAAVPYVHLHLEARRRFYPHVPALVCDDGSRFERELAGVCQEYGAAFARNPARLRRTVGDMSAYVRGLDWAMESGIEILVKMSRRFIPLHDWTAGLSRLAIGSGMATFSQSCDHFNFGFRTECIGFHANTWRVSGALARMREQVERNEPVFVEGFIHQLARRIAAEHASSAAREYTREHPRPPDRDGYAPWEIMPDRRTTARADLLWHDCDDPVDYWQAAAAYGLPYALEEFADANQSCGLGEP